MHLNYSIHSSELRKMENKQYINQQVEDTFNVLETIDKVQANHFFKHKVLQKIKAEKEVVKTVFSWFTPQFQMASLAFVLVLNASAILYAYNTGDTTNSIATLETFAQDYSLQTASNSILN